MGILKGIFKARDKPKDTLGGSRYNFFCGSTSSGKPVNEHTAMQMTAVYSCVRASAADGSAKYADAYARLCVSVTDANGNLRDSAICRDKKAPFSFIETKERYLPVHLFLISSPCLCIRGRVFYIISRTLLQNFAAAIIVRQVAQYVISARIFATAFLLLPQPRLL